MCTNLPRLSHARVTIMLALARDPSVAGAAAQSGTRMETRMRRPNSVDTLTTNRPEKLQ